ncbi:electron transfer flavoprotein subunit alpha/FixB family protein [Corynebacterium testudinoris]|uniref:Electron transfer flavoprotein alpha subunit apoprotein n=1 Tax=Corynebacterium testudinoris TaxID=136857 RepID=A0A0G3H6Y2_9CORY|nr:electron transfer flavoprotein subunit alpha/FixB family protein [Corynebacterium testudinoris]AKK08535.1 electron transfer flavoprotein alpha subunit apoprotein [Corynebacterium testudinoris]MBX8994746.1 electron transfer flavoprotein subunit alpha/FixB family protein [Corynebacterium testudinoris]
MSTVYVLVEPNSPVTAELITAARVLGEVTAVTTDQAAAPELAELGATTVVVATAPDADTRLILPQVDALSMLAAGNPGPIVIAAGPTGNEIAGRLAARLASGVLCDVVGINADRTAAQSVFGDSVQVSAAVGGASPIYTLRPGAVEPAPIPAAGTVSLLQLPAATAKDAVVTSFTPAERGDRPELAQAKIVIAGGRGVGSAEGFTDLVEKLADALGGAVGATRDAVDLEYYDGAYQIGQTGVTVSPDLYIGLGISGAIQHTSGMQTARKIVVINNDEDAPIFQIADLGIVGDVNEIVPALVAEIAARRS